MSSRDGQTVRVEACAKITLDAMPFSAAMASWPNSPVERFYRDAPLMMIGEALNEIQALRDRGADCSAVSRVATLLAERQLCSASAHSYWTREHHFVSAFG